MRWSEIDDALRTKQPSQDPFGLGADLPAYSGPETDEALFEEIYQQRSAELYLTGMRFEDMRRLGSVRCHRSDPAHQRRRT
ncbi:MAG: hypothetical protein U5J63_14780 [Fodinibius sp.]|nr:hypothetical protein [Fodinibius sp.]